MFSTGSSRTRLGRYCAPPLNGCLGSVLLGSGIAQLGLSILCAFFFYRDGEAALQRLRDVLGHVAGDRARHFLAVANGTLKGIVYGVIGSALAPSSAGHIRLLALGGSGTVPSRTSNGLPRHHSRRTGDHLAASGDLAVPVGRDCVGHLLDRLERTLFSQKLNNVVGPRFVSRGSALPLLLVLIGILGGAMAFGFIGIFLGPTILALLYALMKNGAPASTFGDRLEPHQPSHHSVMIATFIVSEYGASNREGSRQRCSSWDVIRQWALIHSSRSTDAPERGSIGCADDSSRYLCHDLV